MYTAWSSTCGPHHGNTNKVSKKKLIYRKGACQRNQAPLANTIGIESTKHSPNDPEDPFYQTLGPKQPLLNKSLKQNPKASN